MQASSMSEIREAAENIGGLLDDVWRLTTFPYTQDRMIHMFDVIGELRLLCVCLMIILTFRSAVKAFHEYSCLFQKEKCVFDNCFNFPGHTICSVIQKAFPPVDLWKINDGSREIEILTLLTDSLKVVQTWISACKSLTETYWPNYALHIWSGKSYIPSYCASFEHRLKQVCTNYSITLLDIKLVSA